MTKTEAITKFLLSKPFSTCRLYNPEMEVQVNVLRGTGEPVHGTYAGLRWQGFTDGLQVWKPFRIPWNASVDPKYEDHELKWDFPTHVEAIGLTGWDFINKQSKWVGFDFDSIVGHKEGLRKEELDEILGHITKCEFTTTCNSTSGNGFHVYVFIEDTQEIRTHTEHAAVARSILSKISALTGLKLEAKVDSMGGILWVWHRKATVEGNSFKIIKQGQPLKEIPPNWREYLSLVSKHTITKQPTSLDTIAAYRANINLDEEHIKLLKWFEQSGSLWWFDNDKQLLVCHTFDLKRAHDELKLRGIFETIATGKNEGHDQNCFCFPIPDGGWSVRRHTRGCKESYTWYTDSKGWSTCYYNRNPTLSIAARTTGGVSGEKEYHFRNLTSAVKALRLMGIDCDIPLGMDNRPTLIFEVKEKIKLVVEGYEHDVPPNDWIKKKNTWERYFFRPQVHDEIDLPDDTIRHLIANNISTGWYLNTTDWIELGRNNLISALISLGYQRHKLETLMGTAVVYNWKLVNKPFQPEYPGNREWNKNAAQFRYIPKRGKHPFWDIVLEHIGSGLNESLKHNGWAKDNGIINGYLYLLAWISATCTFPSDGTPYLFIHGPQNCGKSIFHESLSLLFTKGMCRADQALINPTGFNGELAGAIACVVEEVNLSKKGLALDRIKDWVTGKTISIHTKGKTPYDITNTTHWIQCANSIEYCPVFPGDTRITMVKVSQFTERTEIPKPLLLKHLEQEAPAFLWTVLNFEIPDPIGRLRVPTITTEEKLEQMEYNTDALTIFIRERIFQCPGHKILFADLYNVFIQTLPFDERGNWSNRRVAKELPFLKGKSGTANSLYVANIAFEQMNGKMMPLIKNGDRLVEAT